MNKKLYAISLAVLSLGLLSFSPALITEVYNIDAGHTSVTAKVKRFSVVDVVGRFTDVSGTVDYDGESIESLKTNVVIKTASWTANNKDGENAVKSPAFLDVAKYPEITFSSTKFYQKDGMNYAAGDLTIHGTTNSVEFPFKLIGPFKDPTGLTTIGIYAQLEINRQDYGIKFDRKMGNGEMLIGNEVAIELNVLAAQ